MLEQLRKECKADIQYTMFQSVRDFCRSIIACIDNGASKEEIESYIRTIVTRLESHCVGSHVDAVAHLGNQLLEEYFSLWSSETF